jgi:hypothetical protein
LGKRGEGREGAKGELVLRDILTIFFKRFDEESWVEDMGMGGVMA